MNKVIITLLCICSSAICFSQQTYTPADEGSKVHFIIKNFAIKTGGDFKGMKGIINFDPLKLPTSNFTVTVEAATIDTDSEMRDDHLKEDDYFGVAKYPSISVKSTKITKSSSAGRYYMFANLTIKGITKPVELGFSAMPKDGGYFFEGEFEINRRDFNVGDKSISLQDKVKISLKVLAKN